MRVAVDAFAVSNFSGRHVLLGHLRAAAAATRGRHSFHILHHAGNRDLRRDLGENVEWIECAGAGPHWTRRVAWEATRLGGRLRELRADVLLSTSGALVPGVSLPQLVLAQNPWCFFPQFHRTPADRLKARLQRLGYRRAQRRAEAIFFLSDYLGRAYREEAGRAPRGSETLYVGIDDAMYAAAGEPQGFESRELAIVTVSVMARHKAIEDVVDALARLHGKGVRARLRLVGPWADALYRREIERRIGRADLSDFVEITGAVDDAGLAEHYRRARVFCLLSRCESFGIPAVEAQVFATPCVVADNCAPPEVAGPGGQVVATGNIEAAANALQRLLTDAAAWREASARARANAERFRWDRVSQPFVRYLDDREGRA
jgi:glycosyltransferase involved in cell wall biosynthesis